MKSGSSWKVTVAVYKIERRAGRAEGTFFVFVTPRDYLPICIFLSPLLSVSISDSLLDFFAASLLWIKVTTWKNKTN